MKEFKIEDKILGDGHPVFFIAEAGVNHNGSIDLGKKLVDIAAEAGADAVKFQTFITDNIITPEAPKSTYHIETTGDDSDQTWYDLLKTQEMSKEMHIELINYCQKVGIIFLSTPYDAESVDLLDDLGVAAFKIASTDTNNIPLLKYIAKKAKPLILSTAMSNMKEVKESVVAIRDEGLKELAVLQCTGNYPSKTADSNLRVISSYKKELECIVGYSDHTPDLINAVAATALGAKIYEKHFTADKSLPGPDHRMSLNLKELKSTIQIIRDTEKALGNTEKEVLDCEKENRGKLRKSIITTCDISIHSEIKKEMITIKRPGYGMPPVMIKNIIGKKINKNISKNSPLTFDDIS